jgi:tyrosyl-tRNA synthetase
MLSILEREIPNLDESLRNLPEHIKAIKISVIDILSITGICKSRSEAKRMLKQSGFQMIRKSGEWITLEERDNFIIFDEENTKSLVSFCPKMRDYNNWLI